MEEDWQDATTQYRHVHNRINRQDRSSKRGGGFDAKRSLGSYKIECRPYNRMDGSREASMEVYGFTTCGQGLTGQICLPGVLQASIILAGSRKALKKVIENMMDPEEEEEESDDDEEKEDEEQNEEKEDQEQDEEKEEEEEEDEGEEDREERKEKRRREPFVKNSFRSPKFWVKWQGEVQTSSGTHMETNGGYIVFGGNDCKKLTGTITSKTLEWDNVSITGWKIKSTAERDVHIEWKNEE
ncbi:hypothetical protein PROFUN_04827 [Planoprotostelium fungivorum]|uniref:Uncharacterized protein n=1 Tax=Planoprotostelium fungivorum TaxID=1890364 RepID=A0A2P6NT21_9EUKA|nr:hypothetical protein PROFUN_04827 [Planoprotostelium fungivorum]